MKKVIISLLLASVALVSCEEYDTIKEVDNDYKTNFEAFWKLIDEQYCYLDYKNIDWDAVYDEMMPRVEAVKSEQEFFNVLESSLDYLRDGHVWMISPFKRYSCETYLYDENGNKYPSNFDSEVIEDYYLKEKFRTMASGITFGEIERDGHTYAYIYYGGFERDWTEDDYKYIDPVVEHAEGLIFDIRNNPGGSGEIGVLLAGNFFSTKELVGYHAAKSGPGHNDFAELKAIYVTPSDSHNWSDKPTMLLTNREVYSTANLFTSMLQYAPNVTQIGGKSGGGGAMPMTHYLANGWLVGFPSNALFDRDGNHIECGIDPDILIDADAEMANGRDIIIERAIEELGNK